MVTWGAPAGKVESRRRLPALRGAGAACLVRCLIHRLRGGGGGAGGREVIVLPDIVVESPRPNAQIKVDFTNMPRGTSTETRADDDVDLEVTTGFAMQGAQ